MTLVLLTALGVGGATVAGSVMGFFFRKASQRFGRYILAFSAGVMLASAVVGLILPAVEGQGSFQLAITLVGIFSGAVCMDVMEWAVERSCPHPGQRNKVLLFVAAIAIHNLPEGIAAGVGFGAGNTADALMIAGGIALQNVPEGMVIIAPMLSAGIKPGKTFVYAMLTGLIEVVGTFIGYFAVTLASACLPFCLAFAGGTMLFIICGDMIPSTCCGECGKKGAYCLLWGFCFMLALSVIL